MQYCATIMFLLSLKNMKAKIELRLHYVSTCSRFTHHYNWFDGCFGTEHICMVHCNSPFNFKINMNVIQTNQRIVQTTKLALPCTLCFFFLHIRHTNRFRKPSHKRRDCDIFCVFGMRLFENELRLCRKEMYIKKKCCIEIIHS